MSANAVDHNVFSLNEVFFPDVNDPRCYYSPEASSQAFYSSVKARKCIAIYGHSEANRSTFLHKYLPSDNYIRIVCTNAMSLPDLHNLVLRSADVLNTNEFIQEDTKSSEMTSSLGVETPVKMETGAKNTAETKSSMKQSAMPMTISSPTTIIQELTKISFRRYLVLDSFQKLPESVQNTFASNLSAYFTSSIKFIIMTSGVPLDLFKSYKEEYSEQFEMIDLDHWERKDFEGYITHCQQALNVQFGSDFVDHILDHCCGDFRTVQHTLCSACKKSDVTATLVNTKTIGSGQEAQELLADFLMTEDIAPNTARNVISRILGDAAPYVSFMENFPIGLHPTKLSSMFSNRLYSWILYCVLTASPTDLKSGIPLHTIRSTINKLHPKRPLPTRPIQEHLQRIKKLQEKKCDSVFALRYDEGKKLLKADTAFILWLQINDRKQLIADLDLGIHEN